jgi:RHS repeat-associated protein
VGNRLTQETHEGFNTYVYDIANRLIEVDGIVYIWDDNGNLLDDGISLYTYDRADRLSSVFQGSDTYLFLYNDLGDRLSQTVNGVPTNYTLNIARGLTQVLTDDTSAYLYGLQRIGEVGGIDWSYYQGDAIGSMRQLIDSNSDATMAQSFAPFGAILSITGDETTNYGFAGEWTDATSLVNLRARYYAPTQGRFLQRDTWSGDVETPQTINQFPYVFNNPISLTDPSGNCPWCWILIVLGFATACSIPGPDQISPEMVLRSSVGFQLFGEKDHMPSIGTYLGDGKFITHDHFDREGFKRIHEERGMNIYNAFGQGIAYVPSEQVTLLEVDRHAYAIYKVAGGVLESSALVPATIGNNNLVRENRIGVGVRWSGVPGADVPLEVFEGRIAELIGQITNLSANFIVGAITERGDSGAGFWVGTKLVGVLRAGIMERTRYHYASP